MKKISIENLLKWAFTHELCKVDSGEGGSGALASSWMTSAGMAELGTLIDRSPNAFGVIPHFFDAGEPDADAVAVGNAVRDLAGRGGFDIPEGWNPFPEWPDEGGLIAGEVEHEVEAIMCRGALNGWQVANLVISAAILGRGPMWQAERPTVSVVQKRGRDAWFVSRRAKDSFGRSYVYEADGYDPRRKRPRKGAYRKCELSASLRGAVISRIEWQMWQRALEALCDALEGRLLDYQLICFTPDLEPWIPSKIVEAIAEAVEIA